MNQKQAIKAIKKADITEYGWCSDIVDQLDSQYAQGYLSARMCTMSDHLSSDDEEYREMVLEIMEYTIWK